MKVCLLIILLPLFVFGKILHLSDIEVSQFEDSVSFENAPLMNLSSNDRIVTVSISFTATESNRLELAFGKDVDTNGKLTLEESCLVIGWDSGSCFLNDRKAAVKYTKDSTEGDKDFLMRIRLNSSHTAKGISLTENGVPILTEVSANPQESFFSPTWDMVRLVKSGVATTNEAVQINVTPHGLSFIVR